LQPAYFDAEQQAETSAESADASEKSVARLEPEQGSQHAGPASVEVEEQGTEEPVADEQPASASPSQPSSGGQSSGRGRRRRGGRGRGGRGREQAVAQAFAPAAVKGSIPGLPVIDEPVSDEEEAPEAAEPEAAAVEAAVAAVPKAPAAPVVGAPVATQRAPKGVVVLAIGLPGSGKSSWFKRHNLAPLSSDVVRQLLFDDVREQRFQDLVFSNLRSMLKARLIAKRPMNYVDATNLTPQERQHWIKLAKDYQYEVHAVFFDVPLEVCIERHQRRDRVVPEDVMRRMAAKLKPPTFDEGIAKITVVRVKKKEAPET
jgi:predicted kinase